MRIEIREVTADALARYAETPISFVVDSVLRVEPAAGGLGGLALREERIVQPYLKDYDAQEHGERPAHWAERWDLSNWGFFRACEGEEAVGGAVVAYDTAGVNLLRGRRDLAALWDLRVRPDRRGEGIGTELFRRAAEWARSRGCHWLQIETQNVNVRACRFYARQGCELAAIDRFAYAGHPEVGHEAMLLWMLRL